MKTAEELIKEGEEVMARGTCCPWAGFLQRNWLDIRYHLLELQALRAAADEQVRTVSAQACRMNDAQSGGYELEAAEIFKKNWQGR